MKAKVVFVVTGYGEKVNGGVEQHCKMLAERLVTDYDVEVLSTCVQNYVKGENEIPAGDEWINGVLCAAVYGGTYSSGATSFLCT